MWGRSAWCPVVALGSAGIEWIEWIEWIKWIDERIPRPKDKNGGVLWSSYILSRHILGSRNSHGRSVGEVADGHAAPVESGPSSLKDWTGEVLHSLHGPYRNALTANCISCQPFPAGGRHSLSRLQFRPCTGRGCADLLIASQLHWPPSCTALATITPGGKNRAQGLPAWARRPSRGRNRAPFGGEVDIQASSWRPAQVHGCVLPTLWGRDGRILEASWYWFFGLSVPPLLPLSLRLKVANKTDLSPQWRTPKRSRRWNPEQTPPCVAFFSLARVVLLRVERH